MASGMTGGTCTAETQRPVHTWSTIAAAPRSRIIPTGRLGPLATRSERSSVKQSPGSHKIRTIYPCAREEEGRSGLAPRASPEYRQLEHLRVAGSRTGGLSWVRAKPGTDAC